MRLLMILLSMIVTTIASAIPLANGTDVAAGNGNRYGCGHVEAENGENDYINSDPGCTRVPFEANYWWFGGSCSCRIHHKPDCSDSDKGAFRYYFIMDYGSQIRGKGLRSYECWLKYT